ncbi:hypothetical protein Tco_0355603 [Tanacetum coccineum]
MADDQPMWGNNRAVAPTLGAAIVVVDLGKNITVKGHHLAMIKDSQFDGREWADPHKHIAKFVKIYGMFRYGNTNNDPIKLKLFPSSFAGDAKVCCGGPHPSLECDDKPMGGPKDEEASYAYGGYRGGGYRGNYDGQSSRIWRERQPRDEKRNSQPREDIPSVPPTPETKFKESDFEKTMREFMVAKKSSNDFVKNQFFNLKTKVEQAQKNHQASIQDLEIKFGRLSDQCSSRPTGSLPINPNVTTTVIHDDCEDKVDKAEKELDSSSSKQTKSDPPPLKAYKLKILYPQRLRKEKMEERYAKFIDLIKEVRINIPLVDVLAGMPNYGKFLKDLVSNKSKMEQISVAFLNEECSAIVQNKLPPKLGDPGSFLILCIVAGSVEYLTLDDLGTSINLMPYSLYASLSDYTLKPTRMTDLVILQMEEDGKVPLILGRPFLHTADAIIRVKNKELNLGVEDDRITVLIDKNSIQDPPTDLVMKPLPKHLEYAFLEKESLLLVVIFALLKDDEKKSLVSILKKHKEAFAWKTFDIPGISPSFCKRKINFEDDAKPVIQRQRRLNPNMKEVVKKRLSNFSMLVSFTPSKIVLG